MNFEEYVKEAVKSYKGVNEIGDAAELIVGAAYDLDNKSLKTFLKDFDKENRTNFVNQIDQVRKSLFSILDKLEELADEEELAGEDEDE